MSAEGFSQQPQALSEPFAEFVFKTANGCNMQPQHELDRDPLQLIHPGCDHCYMYTSSTAWQSEPDYMEPDVLERGVERIAEHAETHRLAHVRIIAHGGEPLLILRKYPHYYADFAETVHRHIDPIGTKAHLSIQTNGLLINTKRGESIAGQLRDAGFTIGLSLDGPQVANDLHRRDRAGRSTHSRAERAAHILQEAQAKWGILGVIDPRTDPEEVVEYLASLNPQFINLFPLHAHNSAPPIEHPDAISFGEWQKRAFNRYNNWARHHEGANGPPFTMPIYDNYLRTGFGARSINDTAGERITQELFITPSGKWERLDTLKSADDGAVFTGRNIFEHSLDDMRSDPGIVARRMGYAALAPLCQGCEVRDYCFGGHYPNRFKAPDEPLTPQSSVEAFVEAFRNPNAHCADHKIFLGYIDKLVKSVRKSTQPIPAEVSAKPTPLASFRQSSENRAAAHVNALSYLPYAQKLVAHCSDFQSFPFPLTGDGYYLEPRHIDSAFKAIQERHLTGRAALMTANMIAKNMHPGPVAFYAGEHEDRIPTDREIVMLSTDYNDAIVNSVLSQANPHFKNVESWIRQKGGGYWFISREIADRLFESHAKISAFVIPAQLPVGTPETTFFGTEYGINYWQDIAHRSITSPIPVSAYDLPRDLMIVDAHDNTSQHVTSLVEEAAKAMETYKNPELLAKAFRESGRGNITPLWGIWPSSYCGLEWRSRSHLPGVPSRLAADERTVRIITSQIGGHDIPTYGSSSFYKAILDEQRSASSSAQDSSSIR